MSATAPQMRLCGSCGKLRSVEKFTRYRKGEAALRPSCKVCRNEDLRLQRKRRRLHKFKKAMTAIGRIRQADKLFALLEIVYTQYGGLRQFAMEIMHWHEYARKGKRGSLLAGKIGVATLQMMIIGMEEQERQRKAAEKEHEEEYSYLTYDEYIREKTETMFGMVKIRIHYHPEVAIRAALELGWEVIPPDDVLAAANGTGPQVEFKSR